MICCKNVVDVTLLFSRNDMSTTILQQILSGRLLPIVIVWLKK